jgi:ketosteroid isomerase-like protein
MAGKEGIPRAFLTFAAEDAVLMRNNIIIKGKDAIQENFLKQSGNWASAQLTWEPSYVDVAASGDLGYTYGSFMYTTKDSIGNLVSMEGVFHTVWKRQPDGAWRFVWD